MSEQFHGPSLLLKLRVEKHAEEHGLSYNQAFADYTRLGEGAELIKKVRAFEQSSDQSAIRKAEREEMRKARANDEAATRNLARATYEEIQTGRDGREAVATARLNELADEYILSERARAAREVTRSQAMAEVMMRGEGLKLYQELRQIDQERALKRTTAVSSGPGRAIRS